MTMDADVERVLGPETREWIGRSTDLVPFAEPVTAGDVRRYVEATGDANPLWLDDEYARAAGYRNRIVPPMMVPKTILRPIAPGTAGVNFWEQIPLPKGYTDTRNAETEVEWLQPIYLDQPLAFRHRIVDIVPRKGRSGIGLYITWETEVQNQEAQVVVRVRQTIVKLPGRAAAGAATGHGGE